MVVSHISARLKEQTDDAIDTPIPTFAFTSIDGKVAGSSVGSNISLS